MKDVHVDLMGKDGAQGALGAEILANGLSLYSKRPFIEKDGKTYITVYNPENPEKSKVLQVNTNGTLRRDEWKQLDEALVDISRIRLTGVNDLISRGLTFNLGNAMGTTILESHNISDALEAELSMDGVTRAKGDRQEFGAVYLPIPIIHADYEINQRVLEASRKLGNPLDVSMVESAGFKVAMKLEKMLFTSETYKFGNGQIYSYVNHPNRILATGTVWDDSATTPKDIVDMVRDMKQKSINKKHYGKWVVYIPTAYETVLDDDYDTSGQSTQTIRERIMKIEGIQDIKVVDLLADDTVLMVQMTKNVVRLINGMPLTNIQWATEGGFVNKYKALAIQVPQIRADFDGNTGLVHMTCS